MYNTIGERISYCRNLLGLSRREMILLWDTVTESTLTRWELNAHTSPQNKLDELVAFFCANGIVVNKEWILFATGTQPINKNLHPTKSLNFDEIAFSTLNGLKNSIKDFKILQINTSFFEPILYNGDYIGGVLQENIKNLTNKLCFILMETSVNVGIFNYEKLLITNFFGQNIKLNSTFKIGNILWTAKRF